MPKSTDLRSPAERDALVLEQLPMVDRIFRGLCRQNSEWMARKDDAMQDGYLGLLHAAEHWDPDRGEFEPYAHRCAWGMMLNGVRPFPHPRNEKASARAREQTIHGHEFLLDEPGTDTLGLCRQTGEVPMAIGRLTRALENPPERALKHPSYWRMADIIVFRAMGVTLETIAESMGVTRQRVEQMHKRGRLMLQHLIEDATSTPVHM